MTLTNEDFMKIRNFLAMYVDYLRTTKKPDDSYRADAIEDLIRKL